MATKRQECSVCLEVFKNPKLLPCHHTFCSTCLDGIIKSSADKGHVDCPLCKRKAQIPAEGVLGFQTNFYIDNDVETSEQGSRLTCDICGPKIVAVVRCIDCDENLCQSCCSYHQKMKITKTHKIRDFSDKETKGKIRQRSFCIEHEEEDIKVVCVQCNLPICLVCKTINHEGHPAKTLAKAASDIKESYEERLKKCNLKLEELNEKYRKGEETLGKMNSVEQGEIKAVTESCMRLITVIRKDEVDMQGKIKSTYDTLRQVNVDFMSAIKDDMERYRSLISAVREDIEQLSDIELLKKNQEMEQRFSWITDKMEMTSSSRGTEKKLFIPQEEECTTLAHFIGKIEDSIESENKQNEKGDDCDGEKVQEVVEEEEQKSTEEETNNVKWEMKAEKRGKSKRVVNSKTTPTCQIQESKTRKEEDMVFETFYHRSGKEFQCIYQNGMRFYLDDWGSKESQPFPKRWYNEGLLVTNSIVKDETKYSASGTTVSGADRQSYRKDGDNDREGYIMHPTRGKVQTYIFYKKHNVHMYLDNDTGGWIRLPIEWELRHPLVKELVQQVEESIPSWKNKYQILAMLRSCNYDPDECIKSYMHLEGDVWMKSSKAAAVGRK